MAKHVFDKVHVHLGQRLQRYTSIERDQSGVHLQTLKLQQRRRNGRDAGRRAMEYTRIERGVTA